MNNSLYNKRVLEQALRSRIVSSFDSFAVLGCPFGNSIFAYLSCPLVFGSCIFSEFPLLNPNVDTNLVNLWKSCVCQLGLKSENTSQTVNSVANLEVHQSVNREPPWLGLLQTLVLFRRIAWNSSCPNFTQIFLTCSSTSLLNQKPTTGLSSLHEIWTRQHSLTTWSLKWPLNIIFNRPICHE